ncbi:MAG: hypothetical protein ACTSP3_06105 [Candidatus Heimdallarchaeaceae archaeon]
MKLRNILLILIILIIIPEILFVAYLFSKYKIEFPEIQQSHITDFVTFLINNPLFLVIVVIVIIVMVILYFALQAG